MNLTSEQKEKWHSNLAKLETVLHLGKDKWVGDQIAKNPLADRDVLESKWQKREEKTRKAIALRDSGAMGNNVAAPPAQFVPPANGVVRRSRAKVSAAPVSVSF